MANRLTAVPDRPVPRLRTGVDRLVPLADGFMIIMASRPRTGSLRTTWVTPATMALCLAVAVLGVLATGVLLASRSVPALVGAAVAMAVTAGAAAVAAVGVEQRLR